MASNETTKEKTEILETKEFSEGLAAIYCANGRYGFVDENLNIVIEPKYSSVTPFYHGASIVYDDCYHEKWTVIDKTGKEIPGVWINFYDDDRRERYEGIGSMEHYVTGTDRDPDVEYWRESFVFDTGERIWLCDGASSYSGGQIDDWNKGYISIPKKL